MLFSKPLRELNFQDVENFCQNWPEGVRVEYKQVLKTDHIPKVISSLANTVGGIWIIGAKTDSSNRTLLPIEGFEREPGLEERITQSCYQNLYPPLLPAIQIIDVPNSANNVVVVVRVPESVEAPHAIENTTRVYVRTNSTTERMELAEIDRIDYLLKRRRDTEVKRKEMVSEMKARSPLSQSPAMRIVIGPQYPYKPIFAGDTLSERIQSLDSPYLHIQRSYHPIRQGFMAPSPLFTDSRTDSLYFEANLYGIIFYETTFTTIAKADSRYILFDHIVRFVHEGVRLAKLILAGTITNLQIEARIDGISQCAIRHGGQHSTNLTSYYSLDDSSGAEIQVMREKLDNQHDFLDQIAELTQQLMWPFNWQNREDIKDRIDCIFPSKSIR